MQNQPTKKVTIPPMRLANGAADGLLRVNAVNRYVAIAANSPMENAVKSRRIVNRVSAPR